MQLSHITLVLSLSTAGFAAPAASNDASPEVLRRDRSFEFINNCIDKGDEVFYPCVAAAKKAGESTGPCYEKSHKVMIECGL